MRVFCSKYGQSVTGFTFVFPFQSFPFGIGVSIFKAKAEADTPNEICMPPFGSDFGDIQDHGCSCYVVAFFPVHQINQLYLVIAGFHQLRQLNGTVDSIKLPLSGRGQLPKCDVFCGSGESTFRWNSTQAGGSGYSMKVVILFLQLGVYAYHSFCIRPPMVWMMMLPGILGLFHID